MSFYFTFCTKSKSILFNLVNGIYIFLSKKVLIFVASKKKKNPRPHKLKKYSFKKIRELVRLVFLFYNFFPEEIKKQKL